MTASTDAQQTDPRPATRRRPPPWVFAVGGALVVIAAVVLLRGGGDESAEPRDRSTPAGAAEVFARAAAVGDVDGVLAVTCLGDPGCVSEHGDGVTPEQIAAAKEVIATNVRDIGGRFGSATFTETRAGSEPGTQEVDYLLPGVPEGERNYLVFVEHGERWFYIATGGPAGTPTP